MNIFIKNKLIGIILVTFWLWIFVKRLDYTWLYRFGTLGIVDFKSTIDKILFRIPFSSQLCECLLLLFFATIPEISFSLYVPEFNRIHDCLSKNTVYNEYFEKFLWMNNRFRISFSFFLFFFFNISPQSIRDITHSLQYCINY